MKTIKELTIEAIEFFSDDSESSAVTTKMIIPIVVAEMDEKELDDENHIGLVGGYVECAWSLQPELIHLRAQYDIMKDTDVADFTAQATEVVDQFRAKGYDGVCLLATKKGDKDGELYICGKGDSQGLIAAARQLIERIDKPSKKFSGKWG